MISEVIGFNRYLYSKGSYVQGKYYNGDINVENSIKFENLPLNVQNKFIEFKSEFHNNIPDDIILIDGIEYIRKDLIDWVTRGNIKNK